MGREFLQIYMCVLCFTKQLADVCTQCDAVLREAEFLTDIAAIVEVTLHLYVFANLLTFQPQGIEAAITQLPFVESATFKMLDKMRVAASKGHACRSHELLFVLQQRVNLFIHLAARIGVVGDIGHKEAIESSSLFCSSSSVRLSRSCSICT